MADMMLFQGPDGGEIRVTSGVLELDSTPFTAVYLALFGGNLDDDGTTATAHEAWWGNHVVPDAAQRMTSRVQALLRGLPAITSNLRRIEEAALADLAPLIPAAASSIEVAVSLPARNRVSLRVSMQSREGLPYVFDFTSPWGIA